MSAHLLPFTVEVRYQLAEYAAIIWEFSRQLGKGPHIGRVIDPGHRSERLDRPVSLVTRIALTGIAIPVFFIKKRRVGRCRFTFHETELVRESRAGMLRISWQDIVHVYFLANAFLIAKRGGAMPIPYRTLSADQREFLETFFRDLNSKPSEIVR
jgi:hypothetical protein